MYLNDLDSSIARIFSNFNIDPNSNSKGSFDRLFWGWKYKDFQDSSLIFSYQSLKKALKIKNINYNENYFDCIVLNNIKKIQHKNGSFDQSYPNELHPKIGYDFSEILNNLLLNNKNNKNNKKKYIKCYKKLIDYSLSDEKYGLISNHLCHHLFEIYSAYLFFNEIKYYNEFKKILTKLETCINDEGGLIEYNSYDPGYQTRSLKYLTKTLKLLKGNDFDRCLELCNNSLKFLNKVFMPDGTLYSMFGSRNTELIYPSGIEYMNYKFNNKNLDLCNRVRHAISNQLTNSPISLDYNNFIRIFDDYLDANSYFLENKNTFDFPVNIENFMMKDYGLEKKQFKSYSIYIHHKFGGSFAIYKQKKLIYRNAGILIKDNSNNYYGSREINGNEILQNNKKNFIRLKLNIIQSIDKDLNPYLLILIRILNVSILKINLFSNLFRKLIVNSIISSKKQKYFGTIIRTFYFNEDRIVLNDKIFFNKIIKNLYRVSFMHLFHTSSSRYTNIIKEGFDSIEKINISKDNIYEKEIDIK